MIEKNDLNTERILYLDCASGISGDMTVAALLDLGADEQGLLDVLATLPQEGWKAVISRVKKSGIDACDFNVVLDAVHENHDHDMAYLHPVEAALGQHDHEHDHEHGHHHEHEHDHDHHDDHDHHHDHEHEHGHHHNHEHDHDHHNEHEHDLDHHHEHEHDHDHHHGRNLGDITRILNASGLSPSALALALRIFEIVAQAESHVHGLPVDQVHFHEVGAIDSIVDITAAAYCIDNLHIDQVIIPSLTEGTGTVRCQHGLLPIPVPATTAIAERYHLPLQFSSVQGELITPTGAAIAAAICTGTKLPKTFSIEKTGMGAGKRDYAAAGILRAMLIREISDSEEDEMADRLSGTDSIIKLETNLDDCSGETLGFLMEQLLLAGARDAFCVPITAKKSRPAVMLVVLCDETLTEKMEGLIFRHSTSIGIRRIPMERTTLEREVRVFETPWGQAAVKFCTYHDEIYCYPEHASDAALANASGLGYKEVYNAVKTFAMRNLSK